MLSVELARELRAAGIVWTPTRGDCAYLEPAGPTVIVYEAAILCEVLALETDQGAFTLDPAVGATWQPRLDQLLQALGERGEFVALDWSEGVWRCYGNASGVALAQGATAEEACARALLDALRAQQPEAPLDDDPAAAPRSSKASLLREVACQMALTVLHSRAGGGLSLGWAVTVLLTLFAVGFAVTSATLAVWLGLQLLGIPVGLPAAS